MQTLVRETERLAEQGHPRISPKLVSSKNFVLNEVKVTDSIDETVAGHLKALWDDEGIQNTFRNRHFFYIPDSLHYFVKRADELARATYVPSHQDLLECRVRTTGIVEATFEFKESKFRVVDVGGQRNERRKWLHCFEGVTSIIFVVAISEYNQFLYEDPTVNRLDESVNVYKQVVNCETFRRTPVILFLNKDDLFFEKVQEIDLSICFPDYDGGLNYENAAKYVRDLFLSLNASPSRKVYTHFTCATDSERTRVVFQAVRDIVIKDRLRQSGLLN